MVPSSIPDHYRATLLSSNRRNFNKRVAVVFLSEADSAFKSFGVFDNILTIAQSYQVAIRVIGDSKQIPISFQKLRETRRGPIDLVFLAGHGSEKAIEFGKSQLTIEQVADPTFWDGLRRHATIILFSCRSALLLGVAIAETLKKAKVYAPWKDALFTTTTMVKCERHGMECLSFDFDGSNHMLRIQSVSEKRVWIGCPCETTAPLKKRVKLLEVEALNGNVDAMIALTYLYSFGSAAVPLNLGRSGRYLKMAARSGHVESMYQLALAYKEGLHGFERDKTKALAYFLDAANRGCHQSMFEVGLHYELNESYDTARFWYAHLQGYEPLYRIGRTYLSEGKSDEAVPYFEEAASLGSRKALDRMLEIVDQDSGPQIDSALKRAASI